MQGIPLLDEIKTEIYSVTELNRQVKNWLEQDIGTITVQGELSNLMKPSSGHWYFTLKDAQAQIRCVFFRNRHQRLHQILDNGHQVLAEGRLSLYEARGDYQLIIDTLQEAGVGDLHQQFELLKQKLLATGVFDSARKKPVPCFPQTIGVITSPTGAAIRDILTTLARRYPMAQVCVYPSEVQGKSASGQLIAAIMQANRDQRCDVLILARGGGSLEDLWAFNDEQLAYTIAQSTIPIVTGIGHEIDVTIADFVADLRAATPTAAAEVVSPLQAGILQAILTYENRLIGAMQRMVDYRLLRLKHLKAQLSSPEYRIAAYWQALDHREYQLRHYMMRLHQTQTQRLHALMGRLHAISPLATLERGYAVVTHQDQLVKSAHEVTIGDELEVRLAKGQIRCQV
ncbi:MAG TPA: exodeoxyribonuclease VII large subunit, partial [Legionellaceae bacterium]|nr:exodeoxyribonuclease VII large subunit [Legionellaceae bacterium]